MEERAAEAICESLSTVAVLIFFFAGISANVFGAGK